PMTKSTGGCPGWPFPTLPCTEQFPALPGAQQRPNPSAAGASAAGPAVASVPAARPPAAAKAPLDELNQALKQIDCASLNARATGGAAVISGTVPSEERRERARSRAVPAGQVAGGSAVRLGRNGCGGDWLARGAPFGTEGIAARATATALRLGVPRPPREQALDYLRDVKRALGRANPG